MVSDKSSHPHTHANSDPVAHDPNPVPPSADPGFVLRAADQEWRLTPDILRRLPRISMANCYIVSTGHGTSGPFMFGGVPLLVLVQAYAHGTAWAHIDVVSADGFGTRLKRDELDGESPERCSLLALELDGRPMSREEGLVRLIVPSENDDALRQVKWISRIAIT